MQREQKNKGREDRTPTAMLVESCLHGPSTHRPTLPRMRGQPHSQKTRDAWKPCTDSPQEETRDRPRSVADSRRDLVNTPNSMSRCALHTQTASPLPLRAHLELHGHGALPEQGRLGVPEDGVIDQQHVVSLRQARGLLEGPRVPLA